MKTRVLWLTFGGAALATTLICWLLWTFLLAPFEHAMKAGTGLRDKFVEQLQLTPRISVNNAVIFAQNTPTFELVTVERQALVRHRSEESWLYSKKEFEIEATFTARAGFNLRDTFSVNITRGGRTADVRLPRAKILSLGMSDLRILRDEDGHWNKLTAQDREKAVRSLERIAKKQFGETDILSAARKEAEARISAMATGAGLEAVFEATAPPEK